MKQEMIYANLKNTIGLRKETLMGLVQFFKFAIIGVINTGVDFAVLNILISLFGKGNTGLYVYFKAISFIVALINSYFFNKFWVFRNGAGADTADTKDVKKEGFMFVVVSALGFVLNVTVFSIALFIFTSAGYTLQHGQLMSNMAALIATIVVVMFNFIGYKFIVFKT